MAKKNCLSKLRTTKAWEVWVLDSEYPPFVCLDMGKKGVKRHHVLVTKRRRVTSWYLVRGNIQEVSAKGTEC